MYMVVRSYDDPDLIDEYLKHVDEIRGLFADVPGFRAYYFVESADGTGLTVTVCDDEAGVDETTRRAAEWTRTVMPTLVGAGPTVVEGTVRFSI